MNISCPHCSHPVALLTTEDVATIIGITPAAVRLRAASRGIGQTIGRTVVFTSEQAVKLAVRLPAGRPLKGN